MPPLRHAGFQASRLEAFLAKEHYRVIGHKAVRAHWLLVTPDMHRVHHSVAYDESSSNFGFSVPWWDRLFGTYRAAPRHGQEGMTIGVDAFRSAEDLRLDRLLIQPLQNTPGQYPINRRQATS